MGSVSASFFNFHQLIFPVLLAGCVAFTAQLLLSFNFCSQQPHQSLHPLLQQLYHKFPSSTDSSDSFPVTTPLQLSLPLVRLSVCSCINSIGGVGLGSGFVHLLSLFIFPSYSSPSSSLSSSLLFGKGFNDCLLVCGWIVLLALFQSLFSRLVSSFAQRYLPQPVNEGMSHSFLLSFSSPPSLSSMSSLSSSSSSLPLSPLTLSSWPFFFVFSFSLPFPYLFLLLVFVFLLNSCCSWQGSHC
jgi:hypothetical protein